LVSVVIVAVGAAAMGIVATRSTKKRSVVSPTVVPTSLGVPSSAPKSLPTLSSKMGLSTGATLWSLEASAVNDEIDGIAATGAKWIRTSLVWSDVEPHSASQDDWSRSDLIVSDSQRAGLSVIFTIGGAPDWAGAQQSGEFSTDPQVYAQFVAKVAARYRGRVNVFELGNEPNGTKYVPVPDPAAYVSILRDAYPAIKAVNPNAFVLTAGLAGGRDRKGNIAGDTYIRELYQDGARGLFDAIAFHPYTYPLLPTVEATAGGRSWSMMLRVRALMVQNGDAEKQIWATEYGAPTSGPRSVGEAQQATLLKNAFDLWQTYPWGGVISWFDYQDKGTDTSTHKDFFGLVDASHAHKPAYDTFVALAQGTR
jgi:hypothetical protein